MLTRARVLCVIGLLCFVPFFFPWFQHEEIPNGTEDLFTLGLPASPWLVYYRMQTKEEVTSIEKDGKRLIQSSKGASFSTKFGIEILAWSWVFAILGWIMFKVARQGGRQKTTDQATASL